MHVRGSILAAGSCAILLYGCGQATQSTPSASSPTTSATVSSSGPGTSANADACSLVTKSDAETALGEPVGSPRPRTTATSSGCAYTSLSGSARLDVDITHWPDSATATTQYQRFSNIGQPVSGLGDQARGNTALLAVQKGRVLFTISMPVADKQPDQFGAMKLLAGKLAAEL